MSCKHFAAALLIGLVLVGPAWSVAPTSLLDYEVRLPLAQVSPTYTFPSEAEATTLLPALANFRSGEGAGWKVLEWNPTLGTPSTMGGPPIALVGTGASEDAIRAGIEAFVARNPGVFRADPQNLRITSVTDFGEDRSYVVMGEYVNGLEVIDGRLDLGLWKGSIVLAGSELYQNVNVNTLATVGEETAIRQAHYGIPEAAGDGPVHPGRLVILPMLSGTTPVYHLAWEIYLKTNQPENVWRSYVDAHDGSLLWRESEYDFYSITGTTRGDVEMRTVYTPPQFVNSPLENERVTASGSYTGYSDASGNFSVDVPNNTTYSLNTQLYGYFSNVNRQDGADASLTQSGSPSSPVDFYFNDVNSQASERDAYYHVNATHDWIKSIDPGLTWMDSPISTNVNINSSCNAYYYSHSVNFYLAGGGCNNTGRIADVVSHEYGHGITEGEYYPQGPPTGSGMGEGFSDIYAMTIHGDPNMAENFNTSGGSLRSGENLRQYPGTECSGEVHCLGEIIMGAMWKTRKNFVEKYGDAGVSTYDHLTIQTVKTKQTNMPNFLTRLLMNDDNDGNLANGTPNWYEICDAFAIHNLPCPPLSNYVTVSSNPIDDQPQPSGGYVITATAQAVGGGTITSVKAYYTTDIPGGPTTWLNIDMPADGNPNEYQGTIPQLDCGKYVRYYVKATKSTGETATAPALAPYHAVYEFMTGQFDAFADDLEQDRGWTCHPADDTATEGFFERAVPTGKHSTTYGDTQPYYDHTPDPGSMCFVTDARGGVWSAYDVDNGKTSCVSPTFDWSNRTGVGEVRFWGFLFDYTPTDDTLRVAVSNDNGTTWTQLMGLQGMGLNQWNFYKVYFTNDQIPFTATMKVRFQMEDINAQTTCAEAAIDDIEIRHNACATTDVSNDTGLPARFFADQNRPNPFNPLTTIKFGLPTASHAVIQIYDAGGRRVRTLLDAMKPAGYHSVTWDGRDDASRPVGSGVYYYTVRAGDKQANHKMMLLK